MTTWLTQNPVRFNGNVNIINVDETAIGGNRKYARGRFKKQPRWLFGIVDKNAHKIHLQFIHKRSNLEIHPIIYQHVIHQSTINSDGAKVYKNLPNMGFNHNIVIHKREFMTIDGIHTNYIENVWGNLKMELKHLRGSQGRMVDGHIDDYMYHYNCKHEGPIFNLMFQDISHFYSV